MSVVLDNPNKKAYYSGSIEGLDFKKSEIGKRFVIQGEISETGEVKVIPLEINRKEMIVLEMDCTLMTYQSVVKQLTILAAPHRVLKLVLKGTPSIDLLTQLPQLQEDFKESFVYFTIDDQTLALPQDLPVHEQTYIGLYARRMQEKIRDAQSEEEKKLLKKALEIGLIAVNQKQH